MEQALTKKLAGSPKEKSVSVEAEARELLWGAVPQRLGDNRKSWFAHCAHVLGWRARRVRAVWNQEARVTVEEMRQLEALQQRAAQREKDRNELKALLLGDRTPVPVAERVGDRPSGSPLAGNQPLGDRQGRLPFFCDKP